MQAYSRCKAMSELRDDVGVRRGEKVVILGKIMRRIDKNKASTLTSESVAARGCFAMAVCSSHLNAC